ncbi:MAG: ArdC-like ssDNA-binding domain-containing protein [Promethearchaeota archaeon]|jgi:hypothetical protein
MIAQSKPKGKKAFTPEQKEQYKTKKEAEKQDLEELYKKFMEKKTIKDFIGIISNYKQMHKYSLRNTLLVLAQAEKREDDKFVGILNSYINWKKQEIQVLKDSKGYKVRVPIFKKVENKVKENSPNKDKEEKTLTFFKLGNVFDISQTTEYENFKKQQKEIDEKIMKNSEIDYTTALNFTKNNFPKVRIEEDFKEQEKKGGYDPLGKYIILYQKSSHTLLHEIGHYLTITLLDIAGHITRDYAKNEILAELTAYLLLKQFDETLTYNFAYSNVWANRITDIFEVDEFITSFKTISQYISKIFETLENEIGE